MLQLTGPFFRNWFDTVSVYHFDNWNDGGKFFTSYLAHPAQGATAAAIFWQNNDRVRYGTQDFRSATYRKALLQAFAFASVDAVLWKMGPLSESSIGNVGLPTRWWDRDCKALRIPCVDRTGVSDMVMNEVGGTAMTIGFQWLDKYVQRRIESHVQNRALIATTRMITYPPQCLANVVWTCERYGKSSGCRNRTSPPYSASTCGHCRTGSRDAGVRRFPSVLTWR